MSEHFVRRKNMVELIARLGIRDRAVLDAMQVVPREVFVPQNLADLAHADQPLPIGDGQTISQPYIVAYMIAALGLKPGQKVMEIGAGSGYAAAVLAELGAEVFAIERIGKLVELASQNLKHAGYGRVSVRHGDGTEGWVEEAPFDAILVSAGAPSVPEPLKQQLRIGGVLVIPVGPDLREQVILRVERLSEDEFEQQVLTDVRFVPLIGKDGWESDVEPQRGGSSARSWHDWSFGSLLPSMVG